MDDTNVRAVSRRAMAGVAGGALLGPLAASGARASSQDGAVSDALGEMRDLAARAPDAPSILNKLNLRGDNIGSNAEDLRAAIGADLAANVKITPLGGGPRPFPSKNISTPCR